MPDDTPAPAAGAATVLAHWMAELDALQALRFSDPEAALARLHARLGQWGPLPPADDALLRARCLLQVGAAHLMQGRHAPARQALDEQAQWLAHPALAQASGDLARHAQRCAVAGANAGAVLAHALGDLPGAVRAYLRALDLARAGGDQRQEAHVLVNLGNTYEACALPDEALAHARQALAIAQPLGMDELVGDIHHNIGNALAVGGEPAAGLVSNQRALQAYAALQLPQKQGYALVAVAERLLELHRLDEALQALQQRRALAVAFDNLQYDAYAAYTAGRIHAQLGQAAAARTALAEALALSTDPLADRVGQARARAELARLDLADGALASAGAQARQALDLLAHSQAERELMAVHQLLSAVAKAAGDLALALHHHELFHQGYARCFNAESARKAQVLAVRHEVDLARAEAQRQRLENARLAEALAQIGARMQAGRGGGVAVGPGADASQTGAAEVEPADLLALGLTPREAEVLYWVTQGKTNDDVVAILGSSLSAVKKHLGRIYDKLGVENRTAAANAARRARGG